MLAQVPALHAGVKGEFTTVRLHIVVSCKSLHSGHKTENSDDFDPQDDVMLHAVTMAGGSGTRFWPLSRQTHPKQFLKIAGDRSLIQSVFDRCQPMISSERFWVVTNQSMVNLTKAHLPEISTSHILLEPCGRNTAPCVGLAAMVLLETDSDATMLVMPADHVIAPTAVFQQAVRTAEKLLEKDERRLILFGVVPNAPATGFGYIERETRIADSAFAVSSFREKPDLETAEQYLQDGRFYWNCGIFVWKAKTILDALGVHQPEIFQILNELKSYVGTPDWDSKLAELFPQMPSISIDYAVLENHSEICVVEAPFDWDDVGSWGAMARLNTQDERGNSAVGTHCLVDSSDCIVHAPNNHLVAVLGMENCIVVHTPDATLVAHRDDENAVRRLVEELKKQGIDDVL